jgi:hypothetical protein
VVIGPTLPALQAASPTDSPRRVNMMVLQMMYHENRLEPITKTLDGCKPGSDSKAPGGFP